MVYMYLEATSGRGWGENFHSITPVWDGEVPEHWAVKQGFGP